MKAFFTIALLLSPLFSVYQIGSSAAAAQSSQVEAEAHTDYVAIRNQAWFLAREADSLGDASTLSGMHTLHGLADLVRDRARDVRLLAKRAAAGQSIEAEQFNRAFSNLAIAVDNLDAEWESGPYEENALLRNDYEETKSRYDSLALLWD